MQTAKLFVNGSSQAVRLPKIYTIEQTEKFLKLLEEAPLKWRTFSFIDDYK